jgi:hypothetical protein
MRAGISRHSTIGYLLAAFAVAASVGGCLYYASIVQTEAYAVWETADLVIAYTDQREHWPRGWGDLEPFAAGMGDHPYQTKREGRGEIGVRPGLDVGQLEKLVEVDWSVDIQELERAARRNDGVPCRVIWLRSGRHSAYAGCEPNWLIRRYLEGRYRPIKR